MLAIIPRPAEVEMLPGEFRLTSATPITCDEGNRANAACLDAMLAPPGGQRRGFEAGHSTPTGGICLRLDPACARLGEEGYRLEIRAEGVNLSAATACGVFRGVQSLRQMLPADLEAGGRLPADGWRLPAVRVRDEPRFTWRGFMLDEGRHFLGMEAVLKTLDVMALLKLNRFHWHLTEDQGWRLEVRKYPRLTEIGSRRAGTCQSRFAKRHDGKPQEGFYTQEEVRQVVAYAAARHIEVIPEIEMPGHSLAALAAHPLLGCRGGPFEVACCFGIFPDIQCAGRETTFEFLQDVLEEVLELFPSAWIHIGGDEAPKTRWKECPDCQRRKEEHHLRDEHDLQVYFTNRIARHLCARGRRPIGWNQVLDPSLDASVCLQYWLGSQKELTAALRQGRQVIMSSYLDTYLDHSYSLMPLSRAYNYEPVPTGLDEGCADNILGLEFPLWSEWVPNRARLDYQVYPRLVAMAETGWTPAKHTDYSDFQQRLMHLLPRLERLGVAYAPLDEVEPPLLRRWFGIFTIPLAQRRVAPSSREAAER